MCCGRLCVRCAGLPRLNIAEFKLHDFAKCGFKSTHDAEKRAETAKVAWLLTSFFPGMIHARHASKGNLEKRRSACYTQTRE